MHDSALSITRKKPNAPEIITFGEAMALLIAQSTGDLAEVEHFERRIAGADTNVAIGLARLGFHVGWLSRVGSDSLGRYIRKTLEDEGLDCQHMRTDPNLATGIMFKSRAEGAADPSVEYFRKGSAASALSPDDARDLDFTSLRHLHVTGIPPALSDSCLALTQHMQENARRAGASISFDPNLRPSLWRDEAHMRTTLNAIASNADWVLPGLAEGQLLSGYEKPEDIANFYLDRGCKAVIIKLGSEGSFYRGVLEGALTDTVMAGIEVDTVVDTVGAGDGFAVGVISALLDGLSPARALLRGNLIGAQAVQVSGDMEGLPTRQLLQTLEHTANAQQRDRAKC
ncbi:sugar kinase [Pseudomonas sp. MS19]|uniref:sugar kinase n=1 Tax=Pseudomonas sp. MS19 TaxID=2579939 RepID=UPI001561DC4D|nr:sugar kinase [Pseudomonas sp. MS19]NRH28975.1 sugar kinase [Pseudomonas sp. MS19]